MNKYIKFILSLPKTIWTNFCYLPIKQAIKLPILVAYDVSIHSCRGGIVLPTQVRFGMIHIGFFQVTACKHNITKIKIDGHLIFSGTSNLGKSSIIKVRKGALMKVGNNFQISSASAFDCYESIIIGDNVLVGWDCLVMDSDGHNIYGEDNTQINKNKGIVINDKVWIGCRCTLLKGSIIPSNCVVGAGTTISGQKFEESSIIAGAPPKSIKKINGWTI